MPFQQNEKTISNNRIVVNFNDNGSFNILHKSTGKQYKNLGILEDRADTGDEYNYSYPDKDKIYTSEHIKADIRIEEATESKVVVRTEYVLELPESDANNHITRSEKLRMLPVENYYTIEAESEMQARKFLRLMHNASGRCSLNMLFIRIKEMLINPLFVKNQTFLTANLLAAPPPGIVGYYRNQNLSLRFLTVLTQ